MHLHLIDWIIALQTLHPGPFLRQSEFFRLRPETAMPEWQRIKVRSEGRPEIMRRKSMRAGKRTLLLALSLAMLGEFSLVGPCRAQGRTVKVRIFTGDRFDPTPPVLDLAFDAKTFSVQKDRQNMANSSLLRNAVNVIKEEADRGYNKDDLAEPGETKLGLYIPGNIPTGICFCGGHVLLMHTMKSGPVPPMVVYGDSFYPLLKKYGVQRTYESQADVGDVVAYFYDGATKPAHVATVCEKGFTPRVISKDAEERVYKTHINKVWPDGYRRYEIWYVKDWGKFNVQVIAESIEFSGDPVVTPANPYVGDTVTVTFKFKVGNLPAPTTPLEITAESNLVDGSGYPVCPNITKKPFPTRKTNGGADYFEGEESFQAVVSKPGEHSWVLSLSAEQAPGLDEPKAEYEPQQKTAKFSVSALPEISNFEIDVSPGQLTEGGKGKVKVRYDLKGVPGPGKPPLRITRIAELIHRPEDGTGARSRMLRRTENDYNSPTGERTIMAYSTIRNAGKAGTNTLKVTLKLEIPGRSPIEVIKEGTFQVVKP